MPAVRRPDWREDRSPRRSITDVATLVALDRCVMAVSGLAFDVARLEVLMEVSGRWDLEVDGAFLVEVPGRDASEWETSW